VDDAALVGVVDRAGQRLDQGGRGGRRRDVGGDGLRQGAAADVLQRVERSALRRADLVDLDDVGVLELGDRLRLGAEADQRFGVGQIARQDHFQGDEPVELDLPGLVDDAHAAAAQLAEDLITANDRDRMDRLGGEHPVEAGRLDRPLAGARGHVRAPEADGRGLGPRDVVGVGVVRGRWRGVEDEGRLGAVRELVVGNAAGRTAVEVVGENGVIGRGQLPGEVALKVVAGGATAHDCARKRKRGHLRAPGRYLFQL
jgi:hypothetical protein